MGRFADKVAVITGGTSGIGLATAKQLASEGAKIAVTGRTPETAEGVKPALGPEALVAAADVTDADQLDALFERVRATFGRIDVLFANAGAAKLAPVSETTEELFDSVMAANLKGAYFTAQKALPLMSDGGAIVFTTSWFVETGIAGTSVVSASKAALRSLTRTLAAELIGRNIRVNAVSPGVTETPLFDKLGLSADAVQEMGANLLKTIPAGRFGTPDEIAKAVAFLASDDASYITGVELAVDGGRTQL